MGPAPMPVRSSSMETGRPARSNTLTSTVGVLSAPLRTSCINAATDGWYLGKMRSMKRRPTSCSSGYLRMASWRRLDAMMPPPGFHDHRIGGLVEQDLVAFLRCAEVPRPARHLVFKPFRVLAETGRHPVEAVGQLFDLIARRDIETVVELAPTDQGRSLLEHLDRTHDPAGQEAAGHEHEEEHPD